MKHTGRALSSGASAIGNGCEPAGRPQHIQIYVLRMSRKYQKVRPEPGEQLSRLVQQAPTRRSPLRNEGIASIPVDHDSRLQLLRFEPPGGLDVEPIWSPEVADQLRQIVSEHVRSSDLLAQGLSPTRTAILTRPPGVGKTRAARWLATQLDRPLLTLDLSAVMSSFLGRTGANVRHLLDYAKDVSCVLLLDKLDAIAKRRDDTQEVGELKRLVTVLLQEIDDWPEGAAASSHSSNYCSKGPGALGYRLRTAVATGGRGVRRRWRRVLRGID